jgi:HEAT repeat protein
VLLAVVGAGCGSRAAAGPSPERAIAGFDPGRAVIDSSFGALDYVVMRHPGETRAAALGHLGAKTAAVRYAAIYALALTAEKRDGDTLFSFLRSRNETVRILAAAALARLHDRRSLPTLIDSLRSSKEVAFWSPPLPAWRLARVVLLERTGLDLGLRQARSAKEAGAAARAWSRWWQRSGASYRFPRSR